jgi:hypothetical protein
LIKNFGKDYPKSRKNGETEESIKHNWEKMQGHLQKIIEREKKLVSEKAMTLDEVHKKRKEEEQKVKESREVQKSQNEEKRRKLFNMQVEREKREIESHEASKQEREDQKKFQGEVLDSFKKTASQLDSLSLLLREHIELKNLLLKKQLENK